MADNINVSGTTNPYVAQSYTIESNDKNTLTMDSFIKLLATQIQNQDMTNPMDNSEMMSQLTQMAMIQSINTVTEAVTSSSNVTTQTYAAGLVGQEVTVCVTEEGPYGQPVPTGVKYGKVESVSFVGGNPMIRLEDDREEYSLSYLLGMGRIEDPYASEDESEDESEEREVNTAFA